VHKALEGVELSRLDVCLCYQIFRVTQDDGSFHAGYLLGNNRAPRVASHLLGLVSCAVIDAVYILEHFFFCICIQFEETSVCFLDMLLMIV
jgi:hypothetical protein